MFAKKKEGQRFMILISSGTCDATKVHVAVTNGFAQLKGDATTKVDFVLMAEGGWVPPRGAAPSCSSRRP